MFVLLEAVLICLFLIGFHAFSSGLTYLWGMVRKRPQAVESTGTADPDIDLGLHSPLLPCQGEVALLWFTSGGKVSWASPDFHLLNVVLLLIVCKPSTEPGYMVDTSGFSHTQWDFPFSSPNPLRKILKAHKGRQLEREGKFCCTYGSPLCKWNCRTGYNPSGF